MSGSRQPQINEELLSAYLDDEVTVEERALVEAAIAADPAIAWQVESLRQTVHFLQALPPLALPRAFTLDVVVADVQTTPQAVPVAQNEPVQSRAVNTRRVTKPKIDAQQPTWWQWLLQIWQGGNLQLRNAAAVAFTLLIVLFASNRFVAPNQLRQSPALPAPAAKVVTLTPQEATASAPTALMTAPIDTATTLAETAATPAVAVEAEQITETPSAKTAPDQDSTVAGISTAKRPPATSGQPGEDTFDMSGGRSGSFGAPTGPSGSIASTGTDNSRAQATISSETAAPLTAANKVSATASTTATVAATVPLTATATVTPTAMVTTSMSFSAPAQTEDITSTAVLTAVSNAETQTPAAVAAESWLAWVELMAGVCTVVLGGLWWRSRESTHA